MLHTDGWQCLRDSRKLLLGVEAHRHPPTPVPFQFPDIVEFSETMANAGKTVIVAALDGTFQRKVRYPIQALGGDLEGRKGRSLGASSLSAVLPG